jgi:hypothetical protein
VATQILPTGNTGFLLCLADSVANNVTSQLVSITGGNTVQFAAGSVIGQTFLYISVGTVGGTVQTNIGTTIFGQSYAPYSAVTLTASTVYVLGPFHSALYQTGTNIVTVTTGAGLLSSMAVVELSGVY